MKWNQWYSILCIAGIRSQSSISVTSSFWGTLSDELQHGTGSPHAIPNQQDCPLCPVLSSFRWLHQWGFHLREDLSDFFKFINVLPKFSHALILSWITRWFSNSELFSAVLAHQSQHPNMQLFSVGPSLFQEDFALTLYWPYTSLVVLVFFGCLLSQLGDIYSTASSDSVRFGLLPTMSRFVHIPLSPSHPEDWLSFVKCFTGIALYPAPSFSLVFIWVSVAQPRLWWKDSSSASTPHGQWWNLLINFRLKHVTCLCKAVTMWCAEVSFGPICYTPKSFTPLFSHKHPLWNLVNCSRKLALQKWTMEKSAYVCLALLQKVGMFLTLIIT